MRRHVNKSTSWVRPLSVFIFCYLDFFLSVLTPRDYDLSKLERTDDQKPGKRGLCPPPQELAFCLSRALPSEGRSWNEVAGFANYMAPDIWETSSKQWFKVTLGHFMAKEWTESFLSFHPVDLSPLNICTGRGKNKEKFWSYPLSAACYSSMDVAEMLKKIRIVWVF